MISRDIVSIDESDLQDLTDRGASEGSQLDFKRTIPGNRDEDIKEFLRDVTSFANAEGGDLVFGVDETLDADGNTVAGAIIGVSGEDVDKVKLRLESIIRNGIKPRLIGARLQPVPLANGNTAFVLRIQRSWIGPHVVDCKGHWRFYSRNSAGKYPIDVTELREAFARGDTISKRLQQVRFDRLATVAADESFFGQPKLVLHLQPLAVDRTQVHLEAARDRSSRLLTPHVQSEEHGLGRTTRYTFEGLEVTSLRRSNGYVLVFRDGTIEAVDTQFFRSFFDESKEPLIEHHFEVRLLLSIHRYLGLLDELGVAGPVSLSLALLGVRGRRMQVRIDGSSPYFEFEGEPISRDDLVMPSTIISDVRDHACVALQPAVDIIWNAAGVPRSPFRLDEFDVGSNA